jgi:hypothetical protein
MSEYGRHAQRCIRLRNKARKSVMNIALWLIGEMVLVFSLLLVPLMLGGALALPMNLYLSMSAALGLTLVVTSWLLARRSKAFLVLSKEVVYLIACGSMTGRIDELDSLSGWDLDDRRRIAKTRRFLPSRAMYIAGRRIECKSR